VRVALYRQIDFQPVQTASCLHVLVADSSKWILDVDVDVLGAG
jgi:hypothetical protein